MTIASAALPRKDYTATAGQTVFPYDWRITDAADLAVYQNGVLKTLTTHYAVSGVGVDGGGNVTLVTGATVGDAVAILSAVAATQEVDLTELGPFPAENTEQALDRLTRIVQQILEVQRRQPTLAPFSTLGPLTLLPPGAGHVWGWNAAGTAMALFSAITGFASDTIPSYAEADLPGPGTPGRLARVTTRQRGIVMDTGYQWSRPERFVNAEDFAFQATMLSAVVATGCPDPYYDLPSLSSTVAGADARTTYYVRWTYTTASGETLPSQLRVLTVAANSQLVVAKPVSPPAAATGWNVYVGTVPTALHKQASVALAANFTQTSYSAAGAAPPSANTTGTTAVTVSAVDAGHFFARSDGVMQAVWVDPGGANEEIVLIQSVTASSFTAVFTKTHAIGTTIKSATGGVQEALMSAPFATSYPVQQVTVVPRGTTVLKAPISLRQNTALVPRQQGLDTAYTGGNVFTFAGDAKRPAIFVPISDSVQGAIFDLDGVSAIASAGPAMVVVGQIQLSRARRVTLSAPATFPAFAAHAGGIYLELESVNFTGDPPVTITGGSMIYLRQTGRCIFSAFSSGAGGSDNRGIVVVGSDSASDTSAGGVVELHSPIIEGGSAGAIDVTDVNLILHGGQQADVTFDATSYILRIASSAAVTTRHLIDSRFLGYATGTCTAHLRLDGVGVGAVHVSDYVIMSSGASTYFVSAANSPAGPLIVEGCSGPVNIDGQPNGIHGTITEGVIFYANRDDGASVLAKIGTYTQAAPGTFTPNLSAAHHTVTLQGNITSVVATPDIVAGTGMSPVEGALQSFELVQDGTGHRTVTFSSDFAAGEGLSLAVNFKPSSHTHYLFRYSASTAKWVLLAKSNSVDAFAAGGQILANYTSVGNVGGGEDDLQTVTLPGYTFVVPGTRLHIVSAGTFLNNANNKQVKLYLGTTLLAASGVVAFNNGSWRIEADVLLAADPWIGTSFLSSALVTSSAPATLAATSTYATGTDDPRSNLTIKTTGEDSDGSPASNSVVSTMLTVDLYPQ